MITPYWFLPTSGDSRTDLSLGGAVGVTGSRVSGERGDRSPDIAYLAQIARSAEHLGFTGALLPTSTWCEDGWIVAAALTQVTQSFRPLVALRPGLQSVTLAAHMAATFQRISSGRLLLNIVTGGDDHEQRRYGDRLGKDQRYARCDEYLEVFQRLWEGQPLTYAGGHVDVEDAQIIPAPARPPIYFGGSSAAALEVAARHAEVYLSWGEPPVAVADKIAVVRERAASYGRELAYGIRLHVIARDTSAEAWGEAEKLLRGLDPEQIARAQATQRASGAEGQRRMMALHQGRTDGLEIYPNLWAGVGLVRGGAGTALVGSHAEVADRIAEYHGVGIDHFVLSGYPHLEEAYWVGEGVLPILRRRGLLASSPDVPAALSVGV